MEFEQKEDTPSSGILERGPHSYMMNFMKKIKIYYHNILARTLKDISRVRVKEHLEVPTVPFQKFNKFFEDKLN